MSLRKWMSFKDKENWFEYKKIDDIGTLLKFIFKIRQPMFYRGLCDASYKQYSSIQRYCDGKGYKGSFHNYEQRLIDATEAIFKNNTSSMSYNELSILSFLQHYGCWTPILDFSTDLSTALFFALDGVVAYKKNNDLSDYISIYAVTQKQQQDLSNMQDIIDQCQVPIEKRYLATYKMAVGWDTPIELCDQFVCDSYNYLKLTNKNILAQNGLFILNPSNNKTLEEWFDGRTFEECDYNTDKLFYGKMHCWDINKKFIKLLKVYLFFKRKNQKTIYPDKKRNAIQKKLRELADKIVF